MNLLIHADPGARSGFLAAWLSDRLTDSKFDIGAGIALPFCKIHKLEDVSKLKSFNGIKIRIAPNLEHIDLLSLLFLRKNVYYQIPSFTKDEYSLETFTKLAVFAKEILRWDSELDYSLYTHVIDFKDTFDTDFMIEFYKKIKHKLPSDSMIKTLIETNNINCLPIDKNHACSILKLLLMQEQQLGLKEEHRFWSIVDTYNSIPVDQLYDTVFQLVVPKNYGILL